LPITAWFYAKFFLRDVVHRTDDFSRQVPTLRRLKSSVQTNGSAVFFFQIVDDLLGQVGGIDFYDCVH